jgi:N,N'-diacetyllegionaminate synthase
MKSPRDLNELWSDFATPPFVIAEVAQAHDGSLGLAHAHIDVIAESGADAVKFQTHIAAAESSAEEPWRVNFSLQDATRYDYWKRMEFTEEQWRGLKQHAEDKGLIFLSSPFSLDAVQLLERLGIPAWKIASGEVTNALLLDAILATGKPVLVSSGMSTWGELDATAQRVRAAGVVLCLMQCTTSYPTPPEETGLNLLAEMAARYQAPVGLSDHSGTIYPGLAAVALGARVVEVHVTLSRAMFGPDASSSVTPAELAQLTTGVRHIHRALIHPMDKDFFAAGKAEWKRTFSQSLVAARDLPEGHVLQKEDLSTRKPGIGISAAAWETVIGCKLKHSLKEGGFISEGDLLR